MADIVTGTVTGQLDLSTLMSTLSNDSAMNADNHADIRTEGFAQESNIRRDSAAFAGDIRRDVAAAACDVNSNVKEAGWKVTDRVENAADRAETGFDRVTRDQTSFFIAQQQNDYAQATALAAVKCAQDSQYAAMQTAISMAGERAAFAAQLAGEKNSAEARYGQAVIGQQIVADGNATRALINTLKVDDLNRALIERNAELVECRSEGRYWENGYGNSQFAAINSQLNAFASQLQETRQGVTNFGTMSGNAGRQASTNNVA